MTPFIESTFSNKFKGLDRYETSARPLGRLSRNLPSTIFYSRLLLGPLQWLCRRAAKGQCDDAAWVHASVAVTEILEGIGSRVFIEGLRHATEFEGPCVYVANHMSTLETFMLPGILRPIRPVTFVVKKSLTTMPFFGPVMRSRDPIVVGRTNPREDLTAVLDGGVERLARGISIIVFPQSTRSLVFDEQHFNTIGVKLARKADVPVVPLALKTDAWGQGKKIKEFGKIKPLPVHYHFGNALRIRGNGKEEHQHICEFIRSNLEHWQKEDGINQPDSE